MFTLDKANKKATLELYLRSKMPHLSNDERSRALGLLECGLMYHEVARRHGCSHEAISHLIQQHAVNK